MTQNKTPLGTVFENQRLRKFKKQVVEGKTKTTLPAEE